MLKEFKAFALRGNVVDLAVGVVIGIAFNAVVQSFADDVLMQIVAAVFGQPDFSDLTIGIGDATISYGTFITAIVNFVIVAFALFLVVRAMNRLTRPKGADIEPPSTRECPYCRTPIPVSASRCGACTSEVTPTPP